MKNTTKRRLKMYKIFKCAQMPAKKRWQVECRYGSRVQHCYFPSMAAAERWCDIDANNRLHRTFLQAIWGN